MPTDEFGEAWSSLNQWYDILLKVIPASESGIQSDLDELEQLFGDLQTRVERGDWFRQLLFAKDEEMDEYYSYELAEPVREAFRRVGSEVSGEKNGTRQAIHLDGETVVLEITGTTRGVKSGNVDKLINQVRDSEADFTDELTGLLVANPFCETDPQERLIQHNNFQDKLEEYGYKFMSTLQVYQMLCKYENDEIGTDDIEEKLVGDELIIEFNRQVTGSDPGEIDGRIAQVRRRLENLF